MVSSRHCLLRLPCTHQEMHFDNSQWHRRIGNRRMKKACAQDGCQKRRWLDYKLCPEHFMNMAMGAWQWEFAADWEQIHEDLVRTLYWFGYYDLDTTLTILYAEIWSLGASLFDVERVLARLRGGGDEQG